MKTFLAAALFAGLSLAAAPAFAQTMPMDGMNHGTMDHGAMTSGATTPAAAGAPSTQAFEAANAHMHREMAIGFTGNTDVDFARGMIPHHQGAIDMARIELQYGKDPELRALAEEIIKAQESEIAFLKAWLAKNAK
ncbi:DUF305 domain-containing protein [Ancylobacter sp. WKF20]|uniref:CopM family metallochaperone n=1 Tax=Ancylobacter sp. WKF20 TaxID=3039801 RepID=UPI00243416F0|nr:DUF305 domain-containing protein [Ancylobacter sp. WKF20]WGD32089.1 DUF305 domain-containing protein [Ancylobacter sp. WKF20]